MSDPTRGGRRTIGYDSRIMSETKSEATSKAYEVEDAFAGNELYQDNG